MSGHTHTYIHTHRTTTVTLAAHARRGLIILEILGGLRLEGEISGCPALYETLLVYYLHDFIQYTYNLHFLVCLLFAVFYYY